LAAALSAAPAQAFVAGHSVEGRAIKVHVSGPADAQTRVLVIGSIHGTELAGHAVIRRLRAARVPGGVRLWTVRSVNPDGAAHHARQNSRGVDHNRNFPHHGRRQGRRWSLFYSGPRALSEPESRAVRRLVLRIRPDVPIWYHQSMRLVDLGSGANPGLVRA
jgi:protein MpaA